MKNNKHCNKISGNCQKKLKIFEMNIESPEIFEDYYSVLNVSKNVFEKFMDVLVYLS